MGAFFDKKELTTDEMIQELNATLWVRLAPSKIHGVGVFAIRHIPAHTCLYTYGWHRGHDYLYSIPLERTKELHPEILGLISDRHGGMHKSFSHPMSDAVHVCFMNHSDNPNTGMGNYSLRDISAGEEVTESYNINQIERLKELHRWA
jgi:hypothetical protein